VDLGEIDSVPEAVMKDLALRAFLVRAVLLTGYAGACASVALIGLDDLDLGLGLLAPDDQLGHDQFPSLNMKSVAA
jgi:hypothetical protein